MAKLPPSIAALGLEDAQKLLVETLKKLKVRGHRRAGEALAKAVHLGGDTCPALPRAGSGQAHR